MASTPESGTEMSQITAITVADAQATPVVHTFNPNGRDAAGIFWMVDRSQANAIGFWKISVEFKEPAPAKAGESSKERAYRIRIGLHEPVLETISNSSTTGIAPAPTVAYIPRVFTEYVMSERASLLDRMNLRKMNGILQNNAQLAAVVENLDRPY